MTARAIMIQGTGSDVGKSLLVAGLARVFTRRGLRVRPFKPQNMSNNAAVTADGGEIGRAQALQARAARVPPSVHMNPVLLKPQSEIGAQVVVQGKVVGNAKAREYQATEAQAAGRGARKLRHARGRMPISCWSRARARRPRSTCARSDIANMGFARAADVPVVLLGDIDRGGVIASLVGTKAVIDPADAAMIVGFIVNRFRGDPTLFDDGMKDVARRTGWPALGLVPYFDAGASPAGRGRGRPSGPRRPRPRAAAASSCSPTRASPISTTSIRCGWSRASISSSCGPASRCPAMPRWSSCRARRRPSPISPRLRAAGWDIDLAGACAARRPRAGHLRRLPDARPQRRRSARHRGTAVESRRARPARRRHGARGRQGPGRGHGRRSAAACRSRATRCMSAARPAAIDAAARARRRPDRGRGERRRPDRRLLHPRPAGRRSPAAALAATHRRAGLAASTTKPTSTPRSTCWPTIIEKHVDCDRLLALAREPRVRA